MSFTDLQVNTLVSVSHMSETRTWAYSRSRTCSHTRA